MESAVCSHDRESSSGGNAKLIRRICPIVDLLSYDLSLFFLSFFFFFFNLVDSFPGSIHERER